MPSRTPTAVTPSPRKLSNTAEIVTLTGLVALITVALKPLGIVKEMVVAASFGVSSHMDVYFLMLSIPMFFAGLLYRTVGASMTPIYIRLKSEGQEREAAEFLCTVVWTYLGILAGLFVLCMLLSEWVVRLFAPGFAGERLGLALSFAVFAFPLILIMGINGFCRVILEARKLFVITKLAQGVIPVCVLACVLLWSEHGIRVIFIGLMVGYVLAACVQAAWIAKNGVTLALVWRADGAAFQRLAALIAPLLLGNVLASSSAVVDRAMVSMLSEGDLGVYGYAHILISNVTIVFIASLATTLLPIFSQINSERADEFGSAIENTLCLTTFVLFPLGLCLAVYAFPMIELLYERGKFTPEDTLRVAPLLAIYAFSLTFEAAILVFARAFNALLDAKTTMLGGIINLTGNVGLNYLLMQFYGVYGIALATVLVNASVAAFFVWRLKSRHKMKFGVSVTRRLLKIVAVSLAAAAVAKAALGSNPTLASMAVALALGALVFLSLAYIAKAEEVQGVLTLVTARVRKMCKLQGSNR